MINILHRSEKDELIVCSCSRSLTFDFPSPGTVPERFEAMLSMFDVPEGLLEKYKSAKIPLTLIRDTLGDESQTFDIASGGDLCEEYPGQMVFIRSGVFKLSRDQRFVRFYSTGDLLCIPEDPVWTMIAEFGAEVFAFPQGALLPRLHEAPELLKAIEHHQTTETLIAHTLCSMYQGDSVEYKSDIRRFEVGGTVITEGDEPDNLFEMLEGSAVVSVNGTKIGEVHEEEVFGEVSFLTGTKRGATVTTTSRCLIQVISRPDLEKFAKSRPGLIFKLSQTLAQRLTDVNRKLVMLSTVT